MKSPKTSPPAWELFFPSTLFSQDLSTSANGCASWPRLSPAVEDPPREDRTRPSSDLIIHSGPPWPTFTTIHFLSVKPLSKVVSHVNAIHFFGEIGFVIPG